MRDGDRSRSQAVVFGHYLTRCLFAWVFAGATRRLRGAMPHANEQPEKVSRLWAGLMSISKLLYGSSVKCFSLVLQVLCGLPLELAERLR